MKFLLLIMTAIIAGYITTLGFDQIITFFHGESLGLWRTYFLTVGYSLLVISHFTLRKETKDMSDKDMVKTCLVILFCDSLATFVIIPNVLN